MLSSALSQFTGVVHDCGYVARRPEDGVLALAQTRLARAEGCLGLPEIAGSFRAARPSLNKAMSSALGEAIERYALSWIDEAEVVRASPAELGASAAQPEEFTLFHDEQYAQPGFPPARFEPDTPVVWVKARRLNDDAETFVPADMVWWATPWEVAPIDYPTTNGLACGNTRERAIIQGLLEVIERDAIMVTWYSRLSMPLLRWDCGEGDLDVRRWLPPGCSLRLIDLSRFHAIPTVLALLWRPSSDPVPCTVGGGAAVRIEDAVPHAVSEACAAATWLHSSDFVVPATPTDITLIQDHAQYYARRGREDALRFLDADSTDRPASEVPPLTENADLHAMIDLLVARVSEARSNTYVVDMTPPDIREAGLSVAKVLCPGLQPLDGPHFTRHWGAARLLTVASELGLRERPATFADLNQDPHPFP